MPPHSPTKQPSLNLNWREEASLRARLDINDKRGERLGEPFYDGGGKYTIPIYDKQGNVLGSAQVYREDGALKGEWGKGDSKIDGDANWSRPSINTGYQGGKSVENKEDNSGFQKADKVEKPGFQAGGKAGASGVAGEATTGSFSINPDGSGHSTSINVAAGRGELSAVLEAKANLEKGKPNVNVGMGGQAGFQAIAGSGKAEVFGAVNREDDNSLSQWTASGEAGVQAGANASATATGGTSGFKAKISAAFGPGGSLGFGLQNVDLGTAPSGSSGGQTIIEMDDEAEELAGEAETHADKATSAAARAEAAAERAAACRAAIQSMLGSRY